LLSGFLDTDMQTNFGYKESIASIPLLSPHLTRKHLLTYTSYMVMTYSEPDVFGAISHPARRTMLDLLASSDRSVNALAENFEMSRPAVSQHLRILLEAGLVTEQRHGRERRYHLVPENLSPVRDWLAHYEQLWDEPILVRSVLK
jgi:DNA-binding transcriptional ArsR family regulator